MTKVGIENPMTENVMTVRSSSLPGRRAATTPIGTATMIVSTMVASASEMVGATREPIMLTTGVPEMRDTPRSP